MDMVTYFFFSVTVACFAGFFSLCVVVDFFFVTVFLSCFSCLTTLSFVGFVCCSLPADSFLGDDIVFS